MSIQTANNPSGGGITLGGTVTGGGSSGFTLDSWYGNLSVTGDIDDNSTAGTTLIEAGFYSNGLYLGNSAVTYAVSGNVNIASGSTKNVYLNAPTGTLTLPNSALSLASLNVGTKSSNSGITLNGNVTTNSAINISTAGANSGITLNGTLASTGKQYYFEFLLWWKCH